MAATTEHQIHTVLEDGNDATAKAPLHDGGDAAASSSSSGDESAPKAKAKRSRRRKHGKFARRKGRKPKPRSPSPKSGAEDAPEEATGAANPAAGAGTGAGAGSESGAGAGAGPESGAAAGEPYDWENDDADEISTHTCCHSRRRFPEGENKEVCVHHLTITIKGKELLNQATLRLRMGERYGLVGPNGVGKSTLLRRIARHSIEGFPEHLRCFHVRQEATGTAMSALETVMAADVERTALLKEEAELMADDDAVEGDDDVMAEQAARLTEVLERLEEIEADTAEDRARKILKGLRFSEARMTAPTQTLSGGWRMRVSLARALFLHPDVLMLDEPTNHLDLPSVLWLQAFLSMYDGCVVVVSHDRAFLNAVATHIIHFHHMQLFYYPGNYDAFEKARGDKLTKNVHTQHSLDRQRAKWEEGIKKMEQAARRNVKDQKRGSQVAQRRKKLLKWGQQKTDDGKKWNCQKHGYRPGSTNENAAGWGKNRKMQRRSLVEAPPAKFTFSFPADIPVQGGGPLLQLRDVSFSYPPATPEEAAARKRALENPVVAEVGSKHSKKRGGRGGKRGRKGNKAPVVEAPRPHLLNNMTLDIACRSRLGVLGANGAGKSTLLKLLNGELTPCSGEVKRHPRLKVATFAQHHVNQLELALTPLQHMCKTYPLAKEQELRNHLGGFGLGGGLALRPIGTMSGGQKSRVVFATLTYTNPHILILDEPTNHLDFVALKALMDALKGFDGGVILVSHSQELISNVCNVLVEVRKGRATRLEAPFSAWVARQVEKAASRITASQADAERIAARS